jgi:CMP-N,N'-diacetyllegionaminic acid synthase
MRILALIPARGGSKRLPGKNTRLLAGKPLIVWSIEATNGLAEVCDTLVSTDSAAVAAVAREAGALVPWLRPAELATDEANSVDVALHAVDWYEKARGPVDGLLLLQATSPFRTRQSVRRGIDAFRLGEGRAVLGVSPAQSHPLWCFRVEEQVLRPFIDRGGLALRSQDLPPAFTINGGFYLISPAQLREQQSFHGEDVLPLIMDDPAESIDIDTEWDWRMAEAALSVRTS